LKFVLFSVQNLATWFKDSDFAFEYFLRQNKSYI